MLLQYYSYKKQILTCKKCKWEGLGGQTSMGDYFSWDFFEINCPKCGELIGTVDFPTIDEVLKFGTEEDKKDARKRQSFLARVEASELKNCEQLPEIESDEIIIILREEEKNDETEDGYIVLYWNEIEIWREIRTYEYYDRYIELGKILQKKYGNRLLDFEAEYTLHLCGDSYYSALNHVSKFREFLQSNNN